MGKEYNHLQTAHCENGVATGLLRYHGLAFMTEPLVFGMGSGLFYIHLPFIKISGGPGISYRTLPGWIFKRASKSLGVEITRKKFGNEAEAQRFLDNKIAEGVPVGCQVGVFNLPYFPPEYRFHFNAHNIIVYGKQGDQYLVSDPTLEKVTTLSEADMNKVRFAKGPLAPKGQIYYPERVKPVSNETIRKSIAKGIKRNSSDMINIPGPFAGVSGINYTARQILKWQEKFTPRKAGLYLGQIVRMQEEIGTGGGGFRFLYAAFLEEAAAILGNDRLAVISEDFTKAGDLWRQSAVQMGRIYKGRTNSDRKEFEISANLLHEIAAIEKKAFTELNKMKL